MADRALSRTELHALRSAGRTQLRAGVSPTWARSVPVSGSKLTGTGAGSLLVALFPLRAGGAMMSRSGPPGRERKVAMAVLKQHHAAGMPAEVYDQVAAGVVASQSQADGFVAHYAIVEDGGITVIEIWDSIDQHDAWFNEVVKPQLPPDTPDPKFAELHYSNVK